MTNRTNHNLGQTGKNFAIGLSIDRAASSKLGAVSSFVLSVVGNFAANLPGDTGTSPLLWQTSLQSPPHTAYLSVGGQDVIPGNGSLPLPGARVDVTTGEATRTEDRTFITTLTTSERIYMEWARLIDQDAKSGDVRADDGGMRRIAAAVRMYRAMGIKVEDIEIELYGRSSPEDEKILEPGSTNPGFGYKSSRNDRLAEIRAEKTSTPLGTYLTPEFGQSIVSRIIVTGGGEVEDPKQQAMMDHIAYSRGISSSELVLRYNAGTIKLNPQEQKIMKTGMDDNRRVDAIIRAVKREVVPGEETPAKKVGSLVLILFGIPIPKMQILKLTTPARPPKKLPKGGSTAQITPHEVTTRPGYRRLKKDIKQPNKLNNGGNDAPRGKNNQHYGKSMPKNTTLHRGHHRK